MKKLNKKGFTLVELLAVIAILAILMLLVTPNILTMFNQGRRDAFVTQVQSVWRAAEQQYVSSAFSATSPTAYFSSETISGTGAPTAEVLKIGSTDAKYYVHIDGNGNVDQIAVSDNNFCYASTGTPTINLSSTDIVSSNDGKTISCSYASSTVTCTCQE